MNPLFRTAAITFVLSVFGVQPSNADWTVSARTIPWLRNTALQSIQIRLCGEYRRSSLAKRECLSAGKTLRRSLGFNPPLSNHERSRLADHYAVAESVAREIVVTAIHVDRLEALLNDPKTVAYLREIAFFHRYDRGNFNLWELSLRLSKTPYEALERIAVLFQDLSESQEHVHWAIARGLNPVAIQALQDAVSPMIRELKLNLTNESVSRTDLLGHYPSEVDPKTKPLFTQATYHFYSSAYWTYRMIEQDASPADAKLHAFGVHLAYELSSQKGNLWPLGPLPEKAKDDSMAEDLASSYWGAEFGAALFETEGRAFSLKPRDPELKLRLLKSLRVTTCDLMSH